MDVRQHPPEAAESLGRHSRSWSRNAPLEEGPRERPHPSLPGSRRRREMGARKSSAHPEPVLVPGRDLGEREAAHVHEEDPARERFRNPLDQVPRRAAQQQEDRLPAGRVADRPQRLEQPRQPSRLVDDHEALAPAQYPLRRARRRLTGRGDLQIEHRRRASPIAAISLAKVVLPTWRAPSKAATGASQRPRTTAA